MKSMNAYLIFEGNCRQAMEFYKQCFGGEFSMMTYAQAPGCGNMDSKYKDWVIHARITHKNFVLMASDTRPGMPVTRGNGFHITVDCENLEEIERLYKALSDKGEVFMALGEAFFAKAFAMLTDQFGTKWMLNLEKK
ncbi:MAG: VOC family protein [Candidatus Omnitrophica bacterium]|nr:VOC family protein [Candidatus Omnitrophota bacterium]